MPNPLSSLKITTGMWCTQGTGIRSSLRSLWTAITKSLISVRDALYPWYLSSLRWNEGFDLPPYLGEPSKSGLGALGVKLFTLASLAKTHFMKMQLGKLACLKSDGTEKAACKVRLGTPPCSGCFGGSWYSTSKVTWGAELAINHGFST